jgi:hypothetical protein
MVAFAHSVVRRLLSEYAATEDPIDALVRTASNEHPEWWTLEDVDLGAASPEDWDRLARQITQMIILRYPIPASVPLAKLVASVRKTFPS